MAKKAISDKGTPEPTRNLLQNWDAVKDDGEKSYQAGLALKQDFVNWQGDILTELKQSADLFGKKSVWVIGGDGWAYDIGFGGLDHVLASGENINVLVLDSECYSNTGGQTSKATAMGAVAKFSSLGKRTNRKELGRMFKIGRAHV